MRRSFALLAAVMITAAALPRAAFGSPVLFTSDRGYFSPSFDALTAAAQQEDVNVNRVVYETLGEAGLASLVRGVLGLDDSAAADTPASLLPAWVNADELEREPPEVVFVYQGAQRAVGADLAAAGVAEAVKKVLGGAGEANNAGANAGRTKMAGGSSVTAPHAGLYGGDAATYSPTTSSGEDAGGALSSRVLSALGDAKRSGAAKAGGRHFVAGACKGSGLVSGWEAQNQQEAEEGGESSVWWLKPGDELADFMRRRSGADGTPAAAADVVVICAPSTDATSTSTSAAATNDDGEEEERARLASLGDEVGSFATFVEGLREGGVRHAAVYAAASAASSSSMKTCLSDLAAKASMEEENTAGEGGGRALLFAGAASPPPAPPPYVCDDLCKLQTNIVTGLIFFWTVLLCILFGYALMHNLDTPSRFEKSKEETDR